MLIIYLKDVNYLVYVSIKLITWAKDGKYRINVLRLLFERSYLPSELADKLDVNRASISRILKSLKEKRLIKEITAGSRTKSYYLANKGKELIMKLKEEEL